MNQRSTTAWSAPRSVCCPCVSTGGRAYRPSFGVPVVVGMGACIAAAGREIGEFPAAVVRNAGGSKGDVASA